MSEPRVIQRLFAPRCWTNPVASLDWADTSKPNIDRIEKLIKTTLEALIRDLQAGA